LIAFRNACAAGVAGVAETTFEVARAVAVVHAGPSFDLARSATAAAHAAGASIVAVTVAIAWGRAPCAAGIGWLSIGGRTAAINFVIPAAELTCWSTNEIFVGIAVRVAIEQEAALALFLSTASDGAQRDSCRSKQKHKAKEASGRKHEAGLSGLCSLLKA